MSVSSPPGRGLLKYSVVMPVASSSKMVGPLSANGEFTTHPRFSGGSQPKSSRLSWRRETNRSAAPRPPGREPGGEGGGEEVMYRLRPSLEIAGWLSLYGELTTGPRLTGVPHGPYAGWSSAAASAVRSFEPLGPSTCLSELHASATAM